MKVYFFFTSLLMLFLVNTINAQQVLLNDFNKIKVFGKIDIKLIQDTINSYVFNAGKDYSDAVQINVEDSELTIKLTNDFPPQNQVKLSVFYINLNSLYTGGGAKVTNKGELISRKFQIKSNSGSDIDLILSVDTIDVKVKSGGFVRLSGKADLLDYKTSLGSLLRALEFSVIKCKALMNGGDAEVNVVEDLYAKVRFGAILKYKQKPQKITIKAGKDKIKLMEDF